MLRIIFLRIILRTNSISFRHIYHFNSKTFKVTWMHLSKACKKKQSGKHPICSSVYTVFHHGHNLWHISAGTTTTAAMNVNCLNSWPVFAFCLTYFGIFMLKDHFYVADEGNVFMCSTVASPCGLQALLSFPLWECNRPVSRTAASHLNCSNRKITHLLLQDRAGKHDSNRHSTTHQPCRGQSRFVSHLFSPS